ncbi:hypothetical protein B0A48_16935 [Cryoendolithus antarcticus]|uniref:CN hydrolase domain-containing protein n=1 Tax=Cryoendolithus antarcticus TaxID=1507870 RepID=A0A1V8SDR0_9PEZI|nr:hypothetical protein B0A48_16935 [Cryoendolithus antarcticus]
MASTSWLPKVRVAACNVSPIFLDTAATVQKTVALIREAAVNKADLVVFPETHIPAFPLWAALSAPIANHALFNRLASQSLLLRGPEITSLRRACRDNRIYAHVGFNERAESSVGCIWNSAILIGERGEVVNHWRKLVPTFWEKLIWAPGDGRGLRVTDRGRVGRVGGLICGENTNPLANASQGQAKQYPNLSANFTRTAAHCFEAKCFAVQCAGYMDKSMRDQLVAHAPDSAELLDSLTQGESCFVNPRGERIGESIQGQEGVVYADLDLNECVAPKQFHDVVGGYQRFDVFDLKVDRKRMDAEAIFDSEGVEEDHLSDLQQLDDGLVSYGKAVTY